MGSRDSGIRFGGPNQYLSIPGWSGGIDLESHDLETPDDCARYMLNCDFPPNFLIGQRLGTKMVDRFLNPLTNAEYNGMDFIHYFSTADQITSRYYIVGNAPGSGAAGTPAYIKGRGYLYSKEGDLAGVIIRSDLNKNGVTQAENYNDLTYMANRYDRPWVVKTTHWYNVPQTLTRNAGIDQPDITGPPVSAITLVAGGTLATGYYKYKVSQSITRTPSNVESNCSAILTSPEIDAGTQTFTGTGLDDATYNADNNTRAAMTTYDVEITANGAQDTFRYRQDGGAWVAGNLIPLTAAWFALPNGMRIRWAAPLGHTITDVWSYRISGRTCRVTLARAISGNITGIADAAPHIRVAAAGHSLLVGYAVTISGTNNYDGNYVVANVPDIDHFDVVGTFVATETGAFRTTANLPLVLDADPVHRIDVYRTVVLAAVDDLGAFYLVSGYVNGHFYRPDIPPALPGSTWGDGYWDDDGTDALDYLTTEPTNHYPPPTGTRFILQWRNQMLYCAPTGNLSKIFRAKIGEPEHTYPIGLTVDLNNGSGLVGGFTDSQGNSVVFKEDMAYVIYRWTTNDGFVDGLEDEIDYQPIAGGVGCIAPRSIQITPHGIIFLAKWDLYLWDGTGFKKLRNKYGKSIRQIFEDVPLSYLRNAAGSYDRSRDRYILCYHNPDITLTAIDGSGLAGENNCCVVYDFESAATFAPRFIWPWTGINAKCFTANPNAEGHGVIYYITSNSGRLCQMYFSNYDEHVYGGTDTWGPTIDSTGCTGLNDASFGGLMFVDREVETRYEVEIDATGTPDTFSWRQIVVSTGIVLASGAGVAITGLEQLLADHITITFAATTGHTLGDIWTLTISMRAGVWGETLTGTITAFANAGGGQVTVTHTQTAGAAIQAGAYVTISDTTNYNGNFVVISVGDATHFNIAATWAGDDATGSWTTPTATLWDVGAGNQIYWKLWTREYSPPIETNLRYNSYFIVKQLCQMFLDLHPMTNNELQITIWDRSTNLIDSSLPVFTKAQGWGIDKYDVATFDSSDSEGIVWDLSGRSQSRSFQIRFEYPRQTRQLIYGCRPKIKYCALSFYNRNLQQSTTNEGM